MNIAFYSKLIINRYPTQITGIKYMSVDTVDVWDNDRNINILVTWVRQLIM